MILLAARPMILLALARPVRLVQRCAVMLMFAAALLHQLVDLAG